MEGGSSNLIMRLVEDEGHKFIRPQAAGKQHKTAPKLYKVIQSRIRVHWPNYFIDVNTWLF